MTMPKEKKVIMRLLWAIPVIGILALLPVREPALIDVLTGLPAADAAVTAAPFRFLFEPVAGAADYVLSFSRYLLQIASWAFWLMIAALVWGGRRGKTPGRTLRLVGWSWAALVSAVVLIMLFPVPSHRLSVPAGWTAIDFHSHTYFSHDASKSPAANLAYHRDLGYGLFFVTDHDTAASFDRFPEGAGLATVFPGMEFRTADGISLLLLSERPVEADDYVNLPVEKAVQRAHEEGALVICPHWWKWKDPPLERLAESGIDGFEVYNAGYRHLSAGEREELVRFCRERNLLMVGSTDWHGWGGTTDVWTLLATGEKRGDFFSYLRNRFPVRVVVHDRKEAGGWLRYALEPFFGIYYYFSRLGLGQFLGWALWIAAAVFLGLVRYPFSWATLFPFLMALFFAALSLYYFALWVMLTPYNDVFSRLLAPLLLVIAGGWLALWATVDKD